jgi:hypothetical protein
MNKQDVLKQLTEKLRQQLTVMTEAAKNTHKAATGEEAKQEGKYDTRGLEASYLAGAQAEQTRKLAESLRIFESLELQEFPPDSPVAPGALVETECNGTIHYFLLTPCAGGLSIDYQAGQLTAISPDAPIYQQLIHCKTGDLIEEGDLILLNIF